MDIDDKNRVKMSIIGSITYTGDKLLPGRYYIGIYGY